MWIFHFEHKYNFNLGKQDLILDAETTNCIECDAVINTNEVTFRFFINSIFEITSEVILVLSTPIFIKLNLVQNRNIHNPSTHISIT